MKQAGRCQITAESGTEVNLECLFVTLSGVVGDIDVSVARNSTAVVEWYSDECNGLTTATAGIHPRNSVHTLQTAVSGS